MFSKYYKSEIQPYIIAEIGVNHGCDIDLAKKQIFLAKKGGANAVKFQTYKAEKITSKFSNAYWDKKEEKTKSQYELFKKYDLFNEREYIELSKYAKKIGIDFSSTPFDLECIDFLKKIVKFFKISSSDITNHQLIEKVAKTKLPIVISTGASKIEEIKEAIRIIKKNNSNKIVIMHCTLSYPTRDRDANLGAILDMRKNFKRDFIGFSDHTKADKSFRVLTTAYSLGSRVIEKHFTHNKKLKGNDHYHSIDTNDLKLMRYEFKKIIEIFGKKKKFVLKTEIKSRLFARRSLVINKDTIKVTKIFTSDISIKRPGTGIEPKFLKKINGMKLKKNKKADQVLFWKDLY